MGQIYDWEEERRKAREKAKDIPPFLCLKGKAGIRIMPKWGKGPAGEWHIIRLDSIKAMLGYGKEETDRWTNQRGPELDYQKTFDGSLVLAVPAAGFFANNSGRYSKCMKS